MSSPIQLNAETHAREDFPLPFDATGAGAATYPGQASVGIGSGIPKLMIDTIHLLPPDLGPRSNPVLFGVAEAVAALFPPVTPANRPGEDGFRDPNQGGPAHSPVGDMVWIDARPSFLHGPAHPSAG